MRAKLRNVTLSACADTIDMARQKAKQLDSTLNEEFRAWLEQFTRPTTSVEDYDELMNTIKGTLNGAAKKFTREAANERK